MTDSTDANAAGWFPDPAGLYHQRLWSGDAWTTRVADAYGVTAVHHLDGGFAGPDGSPVRSAVPSSTRSAGPALSLVGAEPAPSPVPAQVVPEPEPLVAVRTGLRVAGWYADPCGIHPERSWDGSAWSALVVDRNRMLLEHATFEAYPAPAETGGSRAPTATGAR